MKTPSHIIHWLLDTDSAPLRYRVLKELKQLPDDDEQVVGARSALVGSKEYKQIMKGRHEEGYWLYKNPRTKKVSGDGVKYDGYATTHFRLSYLSELGLMRHNDLLIEESADRYLGLLDEHGDWWNNMSCLNGYNIRTFIRLGYRDDPRLQRVVDWMLARDRFDGGYLCDMHELKKKHAKSCIRGSAKALMAFAEMPEYWGHPTCQLLVRYFLEREGIYQRTNKTEPVSWDMTTNSFPLTWGTNVWEVLWALAVMGHGDDKRLARAWQHLDERADDDGLYPLDFTPATCPWKVGKRKEPNRWVTFYNWLAKSQR